MIIVTGGAGFIGSNLIRSLNRDCSIDDILVVDNLESGGKHHNLSHLRFADYMDKRDLIDALPKLGKIEAVFHQGACSSTTEADGRYLMKNNFEYSKSLLNYSQNVGVPFIYASSAAVYGHGTVGFREEPPCEGPLNLYGFSKLTFDNYVRRRIDVRTAPVIGLRYFNVFGPQESHKGRMASVVFHLLGQLTSGQPMTLFAGSDQFQRDFVHVEDVARVLVHFFSRGGHGIYNCGTGHARTYADVAHAARACHGSGQLEYIPFPEGLLGQYQEFTKADLTKLREAGCAIEFRSLEDGIAAYYAVDKAQRELRRRSKPCESALHNVVCGST